MQPPATHSPIISEINPKSPISEAYRILRTNLGFSAIDKELKTIMVTSAQPGEGKSTTSVNLAVVYAQADKKVLIIDADLRKPKLHQMFVKTNRIGLSHLLSGQSILLQAVMETHIPNLSVITSGPIPPNPSEILSSNRMTRLLEELRGAFDIIILDTPPVLAVSDAQIVAAKCDGVLLVVHAGKTKRDAVMKAKASLDHVKANLLGTVLNQKSRRDADDYYYYYYYGNNSE